MTSEEKNLILETLKDYELGDKVTLGAVSKILEEMVDDTAEDKIRANEKEKVRTTLYEKARDKGIYMSEYIAFVDCAFDKMLKGETE